jgi:hypothetical protein
MRAGRKFPTRISLISNKLLIAIPNNKTPPVAVISFIIGSETTDCTSEANKVMVP